MTPISCALLTTQDCLSAGRRRARPFGVLRRNRGISAYCMPRNLRLHVRWIPSEFNSGDKPSRRGRQRRPTPEGPGPLGGCPIRPRDGGVHQLPRQGALAYRKLRRPGCARTQRPPRTPGHTASGGPGTCISPCWFGGPGLPGGRATWAPRLHLKEPSRDPAPLLTTG